MDFTIEDLMYIRNVFYQDGYVLDFSDESFANFVIGSIGVDLKAKYSLSKGKSVLSYFSDKSVNIKDKVKLLKDLLLYYDAYKSKSYTFGFKPAGDPGVTAIINDQVGKCKAIVEKYSGVVVSTSTDNIQEKGLKELIEEAQDYRKKDKKVAVEKIWDALERLKTYYVTSGVDKKKSVKQVVDEISHNNSRYFELFDEEFMKLTTIGNKYRIRHHEMDKIEIIDENYYDYFYNRCLALIDLALKFLK